MNGMDLSTAALAGIGAIIGLWLIFKLIFKVIPWIIGAVLGLLIAVLTMPFVILKELLSRKPRETQPEPRVIYHHLPR